MAKFWKQCKEILQYIIDMIFPISCLGCGHEGEWLCSDCKKKIVVNDVFVCPECGLRTDFGNFCKLCATRHELAGVLIATDYNNLLTQQMIKNFKYRFAYDLSQTIAYFLQQKIDIAHHLPCSSKKYYPKLFHDFKTGLFISVPLHKKRRRWRGFNQAEKLVLSLDKKMQLDYNFTDLCRVRYTIPQANLNREERLCNLHNSFVWQGSDLKNRDVVLVDDVATTGTTLEECAKVLKSAGAREVWGLVVAKG